MRPGYPPGLDPNPTGSKEHWIPTVQAPGVVMVGLSGHRGVGKSTLARGLATELDAVTCPIQVKWFRKKPDQMTGKQAGCVNPEMPESIDFDELCDYLDRIKEALLIRQKNTALEKPSQRRPAPIIVVVEGFLLFYDKKVCERLHVHLWVNGDRKTCLERQVVKNILAGAETGLDVASIENVFSEKAWQEYSLHRNPQRTNVPAALVFDCSALTETELLDVALKRTSQKILEIWLNSVPAVRRHLASAIAFQ